MATPKRSAPRWSVLRRSSRPSIGSPDDLGLPGSARRPRPGRGAGGRGLSCGVHAPSELRPDPGFGAVVALWASRRTCCGTGSVRMLVQPELSVGPLPGMEACLCTSTTRMTRLPTGSGLTPSSPPSRGCLSPIARSLLCSPGSDFRTTRSPRRWASRSGRCRHGCRGPAAASANSWPPTAELDAAGGTD